MPYKLGWLPKVLRDAGLEVEEIPGWQTRGHGDMGTVRGVILHHTVGPLKGDYPSLRVVRDGRRDLRGPLAQLGLGRDCKYRMIAAGKAWHAGPGRFKGITAGNSAFIGIEAENTGYTKGALAEPWTPEMLEAYAIGCAAILNHIKAGPEWCIGHKEWCQPQGRKIDPTFAMWLFRSKVLAHMQDLKTPDAKKTVVAAGARQLQGRPTPVGADKIVIQDSRIYNNPWEMIEIMLELGWSEVAAFGWTGNAQQESYEELKTDVYGDNYAAKGIWQWHLIRWVPMVRWAQEKGWDEYALRSQVEFSLIEPREHSLDAHERLRNATTVEEAVDAGIRFARPGRPNRKRRLALAYALQEWWPEMKAKREEDRRVAAAEPAEPDLDVVQPQEGDVA